MNLQEYKDAIRHCDEAIAAINEQKEKFLEAHTKHIHKELAKRGIRKGVDVKWSHNMGVFNRIEPLYCKNGEVMLYHIIYNYYTPKGRISVREGKEILLGQDEEALNDIQIYNEPW